MAFEGSAVQAPADVPRFFPVEAGKYRLVATVLNHREAGVMVRPASERVLAEFVSQPFRISERG